MLKFVRQLADRLDEGERFLEGERHMTISGIRIRNILKTCHKSIQWNEKTTGGNEERAHGRERAKISVEGRRDRLCQKAANEVIERLTRAREMKPTVRRKASESH